MSKRKADRSPLWLIIGAIILIVLTALIINRAYGSHRVLLPISLIALIGGMLFEYRRIAENWSTVLLTALGAFVLSFLAFVPGKRESNYSIESHIQMWPYWFCAMFVIFAISTHKDLITQQLHEGMTLIQTIAISYWFLDAGILDTSSPWDFLLILPLGLLALNSTIHAFLPISLSRSSRLWLSLWSSAIMFFLAIDNIMRVYGLGYVEEARDWITITLILINYFLLGISSIYMAQNATMLLGFLPGKGTFFNRQYFKDIAELKRDHIKRYSDEQAPFGIALLCLSYSCGIFWANMHFELVRSNVAIWLVFLTFPWFLWLISKITSRKNSRISR
ncbi:MAG: hypothetical protein JNN32_14835 [Flavobacteriales bacterium]|nr:hypothetical protein [Flavobacteriales bacterium]